MDVRLPLLRTFTLFHASQIDGIPDFVPPTIEEAPWRAPEAAEIIIANSGAVIRYGGERAFYSPATDHIQMPPHAVFATAEEFCGTLLHEASHWTGAETRLNRDLRNRFGPMITRGKNCGPRSARRPSGSYKRLHNGHFGDGLDRRSFHKW
jgi:antirestriction protein ArdC